MIYLIQNHREILEILGYVGRLLVRVIGCVMITLSKTSSPSCIANS